MKRIITLILLAGLVLATVICFSSCAKTVDMSEYVKITFEGADGYAKPKYEIDSEKFDSLVSTDKLKKYIDKLTANSAMSFFGISLSSDITLTKCLDIGFANSYDNLKNGDPVILRVDIDSTLDELGESLESMGKALGLSFKNLEITAKAEGLEKVEVYDPFEFLTVSFDGMTSNGTVTLTKGNGGDELDSIYFTASSNNGLSNGDKITVKAEKNISDSDFVTRYGKSFGGGEKEYTVSGLREYISSLSDISDETDKKIDGNLRDIFTSTTAGWDSEVSVENVELVNKYLLSLKEDFSSSYWTIHNRLFYVYKITVKEKEESFSYYWYGYYEDICKNDKGENFVDWDEYGKVSTNYYFNSERISRGDFTYFGYETLEALYKEQVVSQADKYTCDKMAD